MVVSLDYVGSPRFLSSPILSKLDSKRSFLFITQSENIVTTYSDMSELKT